MVQQDLSYRPRFLGLEILVGVTKSQGTRLPKNLTNVKHLPVLLERMQKHNLAVARLHPTLWQQSCRIRRDFVQWILPMILNHHSMHHHVRDAASIFVDFLYSLPSLRTLWPTVIASPNSADAGIQSSRPSVFPLQKVLPVFTTFRISPAEGSSDFSGL